MSNAALLLFLHDRPCAVVVSGVTLAPGVTLTFSNLFLLAPRAELILSSPGRKHDRPLLLMLLYCIAYM